MEVGEAATVVTGFAFTDFAFMKATGLAFAAAAFAGDAFGAAFTGEAFAGSTFLSLAAFAASRPQITAAKPLAAVFPSWTALFTGATAFTFMSATGLALAAAACAGDAFGAALTGEAFAGSTFLSLEAFAASRPEITAAKPLAAAFPSWTALFTGATSPRAAQRSNRVATTANLKVAMVASCVERR